MAKSRNPLRIPFVAETAAAIKAVQGLDQAIDKLDASAKQAQAAFQSAGGATDQAFDGAQDAVASAEKAMRQLGIKSEQVADNQISHLRQTFEALKTTGAASAAELARAFTNMQDRIGRINAQVGRGVGALERHYQTLGLVSQASAEKQVAAIREAAEAARAAAKGPQELARITASEEAKISAVYASIGQDVRKLEDHYRSLGVTSQASAQKQVAAIREAQAAIAGSDAGPEAIARANEAAEAQIRAVYAAIGKDVRTLEDHYRALGLTSAATAAKQIAAAKEAHAAIVASDAGPEEVARSYEAMEQQIKAANASMGKDVRELEDHFKALGVTSVAALKKQAEATREAAEAIKNSPDASADDITRSQEAANEKMRQYYAALGMDVRTLDELYKSLGVTSQEVADQQIAAARKTAQAIEASGAPIEDVTRAWEAFEAEEKRINASIGKDVRTLEDRYQELGLVSVASGEKQIASIKETANALRSAANGPKELARITKAEGDKIKAVYTSIGVHVRKTVAEMSAQTRKLGEGMRSIGGSMSWQVTAPITLGLTGMMKVVGDYEQQMNAVRATLRDMSDQEFKDLSKLTRDLGASTKYSALETAAATKILASAGISAKDILGGALKSVVDVSATSDAELTTSAALITQATSLFGISAKNLGGLANDVAGFMDASKFSVEQLSEAIAQGGGVAKNAGLDFQQFAAVLSMLEGQGFASGSDAGTSMKSFFLALTKEVGDAEDAHAKALKKLAAEEKRVARERQTLQSKTGKARENYAKKMRGIDQSIIDEVKRTENATLLGYAGMKGGVLDVEEMIRRLQDAVRGMSQAERDEYLEDTFGTDGMRSALAMLSLGVEGYRKAMATIEKGDAAASAKMRQAGLKGSFEELVGAIQELALTIADSGILKAVTDVVVRITGWVKWLAQASPATLYWATAIAAVLAVIGPFLMFIGQMTIGTAVLVRGLALVAPAVGAVVTALGGITLVGAGWAIAIGVAIGVVVALIWRYRTEIMNALGDAWRWIKENAADIGWWILKTVSPVTAAIWEHREAIMGMMAAVWEYIKQGWSGFLGYMRTVGSFLYAYMVQPWVNLYQRAMEIMGRIRQGGYSFAAFFRGIGSFMYDALVQPWVDAYNRIRGLFGWIISTARKALYWIGATQDNAHKARGYATGGIVRGPGSGTSDSIQAWLSNGEGIIRARAVRHYGEGLINAINSMTWSPAAAMAPVMVAPGGNRSGMTPITINLGGGLVADVLADRTNVAKLLAQEHRRQAARSTQRKSER